MILVEIPSPIAHVESLPKDKLSIFISFCTPFLSLYIATRISSRVKSPSNARPPRWKELLSSGSPSLHGGVTAQARIAKSSLFRRLEGGAMPIDSTRVPSCYRRSSARIVGHCFTTRDADVSLFDVLLRTSRCVARVITCTLGTIMVALTTQVVRMSC